jgi:uncharacterized protein (DUF736 family)
MLIGSLVSVDGGFAGRLHTVTLDVVLTLVPVPESDNESAPDYRVMAGEHDEAREVGAAWKHVGEKAGAFVTLQIDDPAFPRPLRANLFKANGDAHVLVWTRPNRREGAN